MGGYAPPHKERVVIYWPRADEPPAAYDEMRAYVAKNYYWVEYAGEIKGRDKLGDLYEMARTKKVDAVLLTELRDLGSTIPARVYMAAQLAHFGVRLLPWRGLRWDNVDLDTLWRVLVGVMSGPRNSERYVEKTKDRYGTGFVRGKRRKQRVDKGVPRGHRRTPEQQARIDDEVARYRAEEKERWRMTKERWLEEDARLKAARAERRAARAAARLAQRNVTDTSKDS